MSEFWSWRSDWGCRWEYLTELDHDPFWRYDVLLAKVVRFGIRTFGWLGSDVEPRLLEVAYGARGKGRR